MERYQFNPQSGESRRDKSNKEGNVEVLVTDLRQIDTPDSACAMLDRVNPNYVIWMAGKCCRV
jgi:hypothetical protein